MNRYDRFELYLIVTYSTAEWCRRIYVKTAVSLIRGPTNNVLCLNLNVFWKLVNRHQYWFFFQETYGSKT